ncbi:hypothetical protein V8C40DRAFT_264955 [Trichoderma camerunense]
MGSLSKDKPPKRKSPMVEEACYYEALTILQGFPKSTHPVWATLKHELKNTPIPVRSKSFLYQKLIQACGEEELDWQRFNFIMTACQHAPNLIEVDNAAVGLYKLMGIQIDKQSLPFFTRNYLIRKALIQDEKTAEAIALLLGLLGLFRNKYPADLLPLLRNKCQKVESLLKKNRGAPKIRQFMELWYKTAGNGNGDDCDDNSEEDESPSQKRRCIKAEE